MSENAQSFFHSRSFLFISGCGENNDALVTKKYNRISVLPPATLSRTGTPCCCAAPEILLKDLHHLPIKHMGKLDAGKPASQVMAKQRLFYFVGQQIPWLSHKKHE